MALPNSLQHSHRPRHGHSPKSGPTLTYSTWQQMRDRCLNPESNSYPRYGGRGITVCSRWAESFLAFLEDMGERKRGFSLDRIDNSKGYAPSNCRWATPKQQCRNTRSNLNIFFNGEVRPLIEWCEVFNLPYHTIRARIGKYKWSVEKALTEPVLPPTSERTHCKFGHPFNQKNTRTSGGHRACRVCDREKHMARRKQT